MPDVTPKPLRSQGNAVINLMGAVGGMLMLVAMQVLLPKAVAGESYHPNYAPIFGTLGAVMALCVAVLFWRIREIPLADEAERINQQFVEDEPEHVKNGGPLPGPQKRSLFFILASVALWFFGYNAVTSGFSRYATEMLGGSFSMILMVCTAAAIVSYLPVGIIASRIGRKKTILIGIALLGTAFFAAGFFRSVTAFVYLFFIMAGKEVSGVEHADDAMFAPANFIITPTEKNTPAGVAFARELAQALGFAHISQLTCEEHDKVIGYVSQLTHAIAVSLMNANSDPRLVDYTGDSFRDLTRIAKINEELWCQLFMSNRDLLTAEIEQFEAALTDLKEKLSAGDEEGLKELVRRSTERRKLFDRPQK